MTNKNELKQLLINIGLCINNSYLDKYITLIIDNLNTPKQIGYDRHHIIPKYYYKYNNIPINNCKNNLVYLSRANHMLAHLYLYFCSSNEYFTYSNSYSLIMFINQKISKNKYNTNIITYDLENIIKEYSKELNLAAESFSKLQSKRYKGKPQNISPEAKERKRQKIINRNIKPNLNKVGIRHNNKYLFVLKDELEKYINDGAILGRGPHSDEAKEKNRQAHLGKSLPHNEEWNNSISKGNKGKKLSEECKLKISKALKNNTEKCGHNRGKICINNGITRKYVDEEDYINNYKSKGWIRGDLSQFHTPSNKGKIRINNETGAKYVTLEEWNEIYSKEGWHRGYNWKKI